MQFAVDSKRMNEKGKDKELIKNIRYQKKQKTEEQSFKT